MTRLDPIRPAPLPLPDQVALVLQGGGALGAYQAGVIQELTAASIEVDWIAGISIGAINGALVAGNKPIDRLPALRTFWERVTSGMPPLPLGVGGDWWREWVHLGAAAWVAGVGAPGFFRPHAVPPLAAAPGSLEAVSWYDTTPLFETLDRLVDWDLLNDGPVRLSVGAVDVESGNFHMFDNRECRLDARHIAASGALPPGLPPVEIDGRWWWDGALVSNTPLEFVMAHQAGDALIFQVDLFPAGGERPRTMVDVASREKDIRYSSRTRQVTDSALKLRREREAIRRALAKLPAELCADPDIAALRDLGREHAVSVVQLIYRARAWESGAKDYEFSRATMEEHWAEGRAAVARTVESGDLLAQSIADGATAAFDLTP